VRVKSPEAIGLIGAILLASASVPGLFPLVMFDVIVDGVPHQEMHVDGAASMQTFLDAAALQVVRNPLTGHSPVKAWAATDAFRSQ
jgi:hypothetical protein